MGKLVSFLKAGWALLTGSRETVILFALGVAAAALYAWGATGRADRDSLIAWADTSCASAGAEFQPEGGKRGETCAARLRDLAKFQRDTLQASNTVMADAMAQRDRKAAADLAAATRNANAAAAAAQRMEQANAHVSDDRVGADWFSALNAAAGLRGDGR